MAGVRRLLNAALILVLLFAVFAGGWLAGRTGIGAAVDPASLNDLERQFAERMRGVSLVGAYTMAGRRPIIPRRGAMRRSIASRHIWIRRRRCRMPASAGCGRGSRHP